MSIKIKAGTCFVLPVEIEDEDFSDIDHIEFLFTQTEKGDPVKTAYWSRDGESRDCTKKDDENVILVRFSREDSYLFRQNDMFFMDARIHYNYIETNPYTGIIRLRMRNTLFKSGEEVGPDV